MSVVLFAGGGGSDTGISCATGRPVDLAINHSIDAIRMHKTNHPWTVHMQEDVFAVDPITATGGRPVGILWASPDCTHFSKAKGGKPVKKEIRGLSWVVVKWALYTRPRVMFMENVEEIQTWGPCIETEKGLQPDPNRAGETYKAFIGMLTTGVPADSPGLIECCEFLKIDPMGTEAQQLIHGLGYDFDSKILCAADFGVPTIRKRWFAVFRCDGRPISFPEPTHAKNGERGLPRWRSAAEIIDWSLPCPSIFETKDDIKSKYGVNAVRPLADNTLRRIIRGVDKFTIKSANPFIVECNHSGDGHMRSADDPLNTLTEKYTGGIVASSIIQYHSEQTDSMRGQRIDEPLMTIDASPRYGLASASLIEYFGGGRPLDILDPMHTVTARDREALTLAHVAEFKGQDKGQSLSEPLRTVTASAGEFAEVQTKVERYSGNLNLNHWPEVRNLLNRYCGYSLEENEVLLIHIAETWYYISDIGLRMLTPRELYNAMGFPPDYIIDRDYLGREYSRSAQVARCGNAVCPPVAGALITANLHEYSLPHYIVTLADLWAKVSNI